MFTLYNAFKFLHIAAVIVWVGGVVALGVINARLAREEDTGALRALSRQSEFFGRAVIGPSAVVTLVAGVALMGMFDAGVPLWMAWGLVGVFGSAGLGATVLRRAGREVSELLEAARPDEARLERLRRRLAVLGTFNILLLLSTVWAMVFKPTLG